MMLNFMWGKFGQHLNKTQVKEFGDPRAFHRFLDTDTLDVRHVSVKNDHLVEVHYRHQDEDIPMSPNLNIFVASFTTCWARDRLNEAIQLLGERVLYFDTDSVIYLEETGQPNPPLGDYLGEFTSELEADDYIEEFASGGPKNYGHKTKKGKVECKVRGFRLNSHILGIQTRLVLISGPILLLELLWPGTSANQAKKWRNMDKNITCNPASSQGG